MDLKKIAMLLVLPLVLAACDSGQPTYSASNANSAPPPPAPPPPQVEQQAPPPVVQAPVTPPTPPPSAPPRQDFPKRRASDSSVNRYAQVPAGKMGIMPKLSVGNCDDYVERYRTCFNNTKIAREDKFPLRRTLGEQMRQWKSDVAAGKLSQVAAACTDAERKARVEFSKVGCTTF